MQVKDKQSKLAHKLYNLYMNSNNSMFALLGNFTCKNEQLNRPIYKLMIKDTLSLYDLLTYISLFSSQEVEELLSFLVEY